MKQAPAGAVAGARRFSRLPSNRGSQSNRRIIPLQVTTWNCSFTMTGKGTMAEQSPPILVHIEDQ